MAGMITLQVYVQYNTTMFDRVGLVSTNTLDMAYVQVLSRLQLYVPETIQQPYGDYGVP